jgi:hypothetical protein
VRCGVSTVSMRPDVCHPSSTWLAETRDIARSGRQQSTHPLAPMLSKVCRQMRAIFNGVNIPIVLCTALGDGAAAIQQALLAGATDYLLKPYERNKLLDKIRKHAPGKVSTVSRCIHSCPVLFTALTSLVCTAGS